MTAPSNGNAAPLHSSPDFLGDYDDQRSDANYVSMEIAAPNAALPGYGRAGLIDPPPPPSDDHRDDDDDDGDDQQSTTGGSVVSSVLTADGIHDVTGFWCVCCVILIGDMSRGVMFPSLWPLVASLGGTRVTLGYAVAAFSFGRVLVNPLFGAWSHQIGYSKTMLLSCCILLLGTVVYSQVQTVGKPEFLIVAQTVLGIGSGTLGVTRAFVAEVTAQRQRTTYMALITAVQYGGFTVTPIFGALFNWWLQDNDYQMILPFVRLNMYTAPAYFMFAVVAATIFVLIHFFQDRQRIVTAKGDEPKTVKPLSARRAAIAEFAAQKYYGCLTVYDGCILGCMLLNASTKGSMASFETLGIAIAEANFDLTSSFAGALVAACGAGGVCTLLNMDKLEKCFNDIQLIAGGMLVMAAGIGSLTDIKHDVYNPSWKFAFAMCLIYSIGYPICHTATIGLFSKMVGRRPQGLLLGYFASAGSLARMFFPIMSGYVAVYSDVETLFVLLLVVLLICTLITILARQTLLLLSS